MTMGCTCEFSNVGHHEDKCELAIPLLKRLEAAKERVIKVLEFDAAAAIRDAITFIRKVRGTETTQSSAPARAPRAPDTK